MQAAGVTTGYAADDYVEDYQLSDNEDFADEPAVSNNGARSTEDEDDEERAPLSRDQGSKRRDTSGAGQRRRGGSGRGSSRASAMHRGGKGGEQGRKHYKSARGRSRRGS